MTCEIPQFPKFRGIELDDRSFIEQALKKHIIKASEYTFTNFYIWKNCDNSSITRINDNICVFAAPKNEPPYFFEPFGSNDIEDTVKKCLSRIPRLARLTKEFTEKYFSGKKGFIVEEDRANADYMYSVTDLLKLSGKKYDGKRNRIKKFLKAHIPMVAPLTSDDVDGCKELIKKWLAGRIEGECFDIPILAALDNFAQLELKGIVVKVLGVIEGFTIGEKLNDGTAIVYIEVVSQKMEGLSQFINNEFVKTTWANMSFINRESDLGNEGLRKAKLSYHPHEILSKYTVMVKG